MRRLAILMWLGSACLWSGNLLYGQTVSGTQDLVFGNIYPGVPGQVAGSSTDAAEWSVSGDGLAEVTLDFTLPGYLYMTGANMPFFFSSTSCAVDSTDPPDQSSPSASGSNPNGPITYRIGFDSLLTVWLGGTIVPGLVQKAGSYSATIRLTVTYTGN